ncbi:hypothetical protein [Bifidobacterium callitrichos]|uniref:hypothetical protein n=1 Tax=Bifidobacterium callitrichos TaxID=762209 RepID=UPI0005BE6942|nr:hypothetical protein [Bifidobacterium callitrichos]
MVTLLWIGFTIYHITADNTTEAVFSAIVATVALTTAIHVHLLTLMQTDYEDLANRHMNALAESLLLEPLQHGLQQDGDKALITLHQHDDHNRTYQVEYIPNDINENIQ